MRYEWIRRCVSFLILLILLAPPCAFCGCGREEPLSPRERIREGLLSEVGVIDLSGSPMTKDELHAVLSDLVASDPTLFFVEPSYTFCEGTGGYVKYLRPRYRYEGEDLFKKRADFAARVGVIARECRGENDRATVTALYDRLVTDFSYDEKETVFDPYTMLTEGRGVCQAYSLLFSALCREAGVDCTCVCSFDDRHAWNSVTLDGRTYLADATWDSYLTVGDTPSHLFFLLTSEEMDAARKDFGGLWVKV